MLSWTLAIGSRAMSCDGAMMSYDKHQKLSMPSSESLLATTYHSTLFLRKSIPFPLIGACLSPFIGARCILASACILLLDLAKQKFIDDDAVAEHLDELEVEAESCTFHQSWCELYGRDGVSWKHEHWPGRRQTDWAWAWPSNSSMTTSCSHSFAFDHSYWACWVVNPLQITKIWKSFDANNGQTFLWLLALSQHMDT